MLVVLVEVMVLGDGVGYFILFLYFVRHLLILFIFYFLFLGFLWSLKQQLPWIDSTSATSASDRGYWPWDPVSTDITCVIDSSSHITKLGFDVVLFSKITLHHKVRINSCWTPYRFCCALVKQYCANTKRLLWYIIAGWVASVSKQVRLDRRDYERLWLRWI